MLQLENSLQHRKGNILSILIVFGVLVLLAAGVYLYLTDEKQAAVQDLFSIDTVFLKVVLHQDQILGREVSISNLHDQQSTYWFSTDLTGTLSLLQDQLTVEPGQTRTLSLSISSEEFEQGVEQGTLTVFDGKTSQDVPIVIEKESSEPLFDVQINPLSDDQGSLFTEVKIFQRKGEESESVKVTYTLKDIKGKIISREEETVIVLRQTSFFKTVPLPRSLESWAVFAVEAEFNESYATATHLFVQEIPEDQQGLFANIILCENQTQCMLLFALGALVFFILFILLIFLIHEQMLIHHLKAPTQPEVKVPKTTSNFRKVIDNWKEQREKRNLQREQERLRLELELEKTKAKQQQQYLEKKQEYERKHLETLKNIAKEKEKITQEAKNQQQQRKQHLKELVGIVFSPKQKKEPIEQKAKQVHQHIEDNQPKKAKASFEHLLDKYHALPQEQKEKHYEKVKQTAHALYTQEQALSVPKKDTATSAKDTKSAEDLQSSLEQSYRKKRSSFKEYLGLRKKILDNQLQLITYEKENKQTLQRLDIPTRSYDQILKQKNTLVAELSRLKKEYRKHLKTLDDQKKAIKKQLEQDYQEKHEQLQEKSEGAAQDSDESQWKKGQLTSQRALLKKEHGHHVDTALDHLQQQKEQFILEHSPYINEKEQFIATLSKELGQVRKSKKRKMSHHTRLQQLIDTKRKELAACSTRYGQLFAKIQEIEGDIQSQQNQLRKKNGFLRTQLFIHHLVKKVDQDIPLRTIAIANKHVFTDLELKKATAEFRKYVAAYEKLLKTLKTSQLEKAQREYEQLRKIYNLLPDKEKSKVYRDVLELYRILKKEKK